MSEPRKSTSVVLPAVGVLTVLLGLYVGAYYTMVKRSPTGRGDWRPFYFLPEPVAPQTAHGAIRVHFRSEPIFAPIHWLDRRIRPHVWEP
jgi:hypothetical protein